MASNIKTFKVDDAYVKLDCELGEAPYWEEDTNTLRFFDIHKHHMHQIDLNKGPSSYKLLAKPDCAISSSADIVGTDKTFAFGGKHGFGFFDRENQSYAYIKRVWSQEEVDKGYEHRLRGNDGAVDSCGRYWLGFMNDPRTDPEPKPEGILFRLDPDGTLHRMLESLRIPNGMSWSNDDKTMYFTDSPDGCIYAYDFERDSGSIANRRTVWSNDGAGVPDGHCQDADGNLWVAMCEGGRVVQVSPQGQLLAQVLLPTRMPTCPVICGDTLFITSAQEQEAEKHPDSAAVSGSLFSCRIGVRGQKPHRFRWHDLA